MHYREKKSTNLEAEVHGKEGYVVARCPLVVGEEIQVVIELEQGEVDEAEQVRPNVDRLVGENEHTERQNQYFTKGEKPTPNMNSVDECILPCKQHPIQ